MVGQLARQADRRSGSLSFRAATDADIKAAHRVFVRAEGELLLRHRLGWASPPPFDRFAPSLRHLLRHDADRCFVAVANRRVVGYGNAFVRGDVWFLASLFVDPAWQGQDVGRRLLELVTAGTPSRGMTITDAIQPVSNALYGRYGLLPATPILTFAGEPKVVPGAALRPAIPTRDALRTLDFAAYGFDRSVDHLFWSQEARPTLWLQDGEPVAYSYRWPTGRIGPLAARDPEVAALALRAELGRASGALLLVPGTSRSLVRTALDAGLRIASTPGLLLLTDEMAPPTSLAISSYGLY